jgi:transglutaminase-like putative cysteine protease
LKFAIRHEMTYTYDSPVRQSTQYLRLSPRDTARQRVLGWKIEAPRPALRTDDGYGNILHVLTLDKPVSEIAILAAGSVETSPEGDGPSDFTGRPLPPLLFLRMTPLTRPEAKLAAVAERFRPRAKNEACLRELSAAIHDGAPHGPSEGLAHAFIASCRLLGVPARYVSGYLYLPGATEQMALHAWAEAWCEERWCGYDVADQISVGERHIKIAVGADYLDACPIRGVRTGGGAETLRAQAEVVASQ